MEQKNEITLYVKEFSLSPGPRYAEQGNNDSGEDFYHNVLNLKFVECIQNDAILIVNLDGVDGYMSSFLDEAFGNLVYDFGIELVKQHLKIISEEEPEWIDMIKNNTYPDWSERRKNKLIPKKTTKHEGWSYFNGSEIVMNDGCNG